MSNTAAWITGITPTQGTVNSSGYGNISVTATCPDQRGDYTGAVRISSNDPVNPLKTASIVLGCHSPELSILAPNTIRIIGFVGQQVQPSLVISNAGDRDLNYNIFVDRLNDTGYNKFLGFTASGAKYPVNQILAPSATSTAQIGFNCATEGADSNRKVYVASNDPKLQSLVYGTITLNGVKAISVGWD